MVTVNEYDANGNRTRLISPRGYDASADKTTFTAYVTKFNYDALNRLTRVDLPTDSTHPTAYYLHRGYDVNGNLTVSTLPDTHPNLVDVPATAKTLVEYFDPGWIAASNDPANPKVHFDYNARGQQTLRTPETRAGDLDTDKQIQWAYFADGQLRQRTDQKGEPVSYTYDADNQLLTSRDGSGLTTPAETAVDTANAYDDLDRLIRSDYKKQTDQVWRFSTSGYDANGNLTDTEQDGTANTAGGPAATPGRKQHTDFDQADWITTQLLYGKSTAASDDQRITNTFSPVGRQTLRMIEQNNGSGTWTPKQSTTWDYFANGPLKTLTTRNNAPGAGTVVESHVVDYLDPAGIYVNGNRTKDTFSLRPGGGASSPCYPGSCTATYTYDPRDRLVNTNDGHGSTTGYTLDGSGNILTEAVNGTTTKTYTYTGNQLQQITAGGITNKYWYDDAGRLACVTTAAGSSADCAPPQTPASTLLADYSYDYLDRLSTYRAFTAGAQTDKAEYTNDALDRIVAQTEQHPAFTGDTRTTTFDYLGLTNQQTQEIQTSAGTGRTLAVKDYSYDPGGRRLSMTNTPYSSGVAQSPTTYTYGYDAHGSASELLDAGGNTTASYGYRPYGDPDAGLSKGDTSTTTPLNPFRYTAKRYDTGSATYDMGVRRFGPDTSRFLNQDLFHGALDNLGLSTDPLTANRYALAAGNPISYAEWDGHMIIGGGGGGTGTTSGGTSQCYEAIACNPSAGSASTPPASAPSAQPTRPTCSPQYPCNDPGRGASPRATTQPPELSWRHFWGTVGYELNPLNLGDVGQKSLLLGLLGVQTEGSEDVVENYGAARSEQLKNIAKTPSKYWFLRGRFNPLRVLREDAYMARSAAVLEATGRWGSRLAVAGKVIGVASIGLTGVDAGINQWSEDESRSDLTRPQKVLRASIRGTVTSFGTAVGVAAGGSVCGLPCALVGGYVGTAFGAGVGELGTGYVEDPSGLPQPMPWRNAVTSLWQS